MSERITVLVEEMKKTRAKASIFYTSKGENTEGEYTYPIPTPDLTTSLDSEPRTMPVTKLDPPHETEAPTFVTKISQLVFTPSPSPKVAATNDQPMSKHSGEKSGDTVPLDFPSPWFPTF